MTFTDDHLVIEASNGQKSFLLNIDMLKDIKPDECTWSMASVGRMSVNIKKSYISKWARLQKTKKKPNNQHFWFDVHEQYADVLEKFDEDDEDEGSSGGGNSKKVDDTSTTSTTTDTTPPPTPPTPTTPELTPEEKEIQFKKIKLRDDLKSSIDPIEKELREKKKEIDKQSKLEKEALDQFYADKKRLILDDHDQAMKELGSDAEL